ncbi:unnamed protein product [Dovyalis caffra]|uniref:Uncharacterized protein n=1 Tax=Dovyalis caffra TaxID=77055 RepID=A0AAV1SPP7_9ROSI|nr:unnamed protein product [Dovyalis caffra]
MPVVDKLPALLRQDLESAFVDDLDNVFDITNLRHSFSQQKLETEMDLKRIKRLKEKFRLINEQLALHQLKAVSIERPLPHGNLENSPSHAPASLNDRSFIILHE